MAGAGNNIMDHGYRQRVGVAGVDLSGHVFGFTVIAGLRGSGFLA